MTKNLIYDITDRPPMGKRLIFAFQQFLAILAATIAVPTLIGLPTQIPAAIFGAGVGTLVYQLFTKFKSPVFLGSSFAFLSSLSVALMYGYCGIVLGAVVAGLVYVALAVGLCYVPNDELLLCCQQSCVLDVDPILWLDRLCVVSECSRRRQKRPGPAYHFR